MAKRRAGRPPKPKKRESTDDLGSPVEIDPNVRMAKREDASVLSSRSKPKPKKQKLTASGSWVDIDPKIETQINRILPKTELSDVSEYSGVQEYTNNVPPQGEVGEEVLGFCGEKIADFVGHVMTNHQEPSKVLTRLSIIQGYNGEGFSDIGNGDSENLVAYNLTSGCLKRIICTLLAVAWSYSRQTTVNTARRQPRKFWITKNAEVRYISWTRYRMGEKSSQPEPKTTFEATVNWVFELLALNSASRLEGLAHSGSHPTKEDMVLFGDDIENAFYVARDASWSLEQTCYIIDRIPEKHHALYCPEDDLPGGI
jgi:hypothetical protein